MPCRIKTPPSSSEMAWSLMYAARALHMRRSRLDTLRLVAYTQSSSLHLSHKAPHHEMLQSPPDVAGSSSPAKCLNPPTQHAPSNLRARATTVSAMRIVPSRSITDA